MQRTAPTLEDFLAPPPTRKGKWTEFVRALELNVPKRIPSPKSEAEKARIAVYRAAHRAGITIRTRKQADGSIWVCRVSKNGNGASTP